MILEPVVAPFFSRVFLGIDFCGAEGRVVKKDFDGICAGLLEALNGKTIEKRWETPGDGFVIAGFFISEEQARVFVALGRGAKAVFGVEKNGAGVWRENSADVRFEFGEEIGLGTQRCYRA